MSARIAGRNWLPILALLFCWGTAGALGYRVIPNPSDSAAAANRDSAMGRLLSASRSGVSNQFYMEAERYFHRGVAHFSTPAFSSRFLEWAHVITPRDHSEEGGVGLLELMPWFAMAIRTDPGNVDAYIVAAYWLIRGGEMGAAEEVLLDGERNNSDRYEIQMGLGRLYFRLGRMDEAEEAFNRGIFLWPGTVNPEDTQTRLDWAQMKVYRAALLEAGGKTGEALAMYEQVLKQFPDRVSLARHAEALQRGDPSARWAAERLEQMFVNHNGSHLETGGHNEHEHHDHAKCTGHDHHR